MATSAITTVARHEVPRDKEEEFTNWAHGIDQASRCFDGYLGMELIRSHGESKRNFFCIFRFDSPNNLDVWMQSDERQRQLADERSCYLHTADIRSYRSLGFWFTLPGSPGTVPSDNKMAAVTLMVIWPLVHFIAPMVGRVTQTPWLAEFLTVSAIVGLMTYLVMPVVVRLLGNWLFR